MTATQKDAARVLAELTTLDDLPRLSWDVRPYDGAGLTGQPSGLGEDASVASVAMWADHLGVEVVVEKCDTYIHHEVRGEVDGVKVRIFTHTGRTHTYVSVPIDQTGGAR